MNESLLTRAMARIGEANPMHGSRVERVVGEMDSLYRERAERFFGQLEAFLASRGRSFDDAVDAYLRLCDSMVAERLHFMRTGSYSSRSFAEVEARVYSNPKEMEAHVFGLAIAQFLWKDQYRRFDFFCGGLPRYGGAIRSYLEVGGGHALYLAEALRLLPAHVRFTLVDVSASSIEMARGMTPIERVRFIQGDINELDLNSRYDFITAGEVLEHVEQPRTLLARLRSLLTDEGHAFITAPANAPTLDHIYLFNDAGEVRTMLIEEGFVIEEERRVYAEDVSEEKARRYKVAEMYAAFVRKAR